MDKGMEYLMYEGRLGQLGLCSLEYKSLRRWLIKINNI